MISPIRLMELLLAISATEGFCNNCPCYEKCGVGKDCKEVIYKWLNKKEE